MTEFVCQNNSSGASSPIMVTDCLGKFFTGINISRQLVWENHSSATQSPDKATDCRRNYSEQMTEKQNSVKTCTRYLKKETLPIYGNRCSFDQKRKGYPYKAGMNRLKSRIKAANCYSEKSFFTKPSSTTATHFFQQPTYPTTGEVS